MAARRLTRIGFLAKGYGSNFAEEKYGGVEIANELIGHHTGVTLDSVVEESLAKYN